MIQNIQIVRLLPPEVSMAKNKMLKLDMTFSLTSSLLLLPFFLFLFSFSFELEDSLWQFKLEKALNGIAWKILRCEPFVNTGWGTSRQSSDGDSMLPMQWEEFDPCWGIKIPHAALRQKK